MSVGIFHRNKTKPRNVQKTNKFGEYEVKKRVQYENEVIKSKLTVDQVPISHGDRFIPRRPSVSRIINYSPNHIDETYDDFLCVKTQPFYWRRHNYQIYVGIQLETNAETKLLNFHDTTTREICNHLYKNNPTKFIFKTPSRSVEKLDWSCIPRSKPLSNSESTHDMPGFNNCWNGHGIVDWSSHGVIAATFDSSLVLWTPPTKDKETKPMPFEIKHLKALKFSPNGNLLALGIQGKSASHLHICQMIGLSLISEYAYRFPKKSCSDTITTIEWASTEKYIICGMSTGAVFIISYPQMEVVHRVTYHKSTISNIKYSKQSTFIAITDIDGNLSIVRNNSQFTLFFKHKHVHYIAWHPWIETDLLIGCKSPASIHLLDLKTKTTIAHYRRTDLQHMLCGMAINPLSAELIVSFSHRVNGATRSDILVIASMNRIVDNISAHRDAVHFILWDPAGTKVATIGQDESLNILHFFGKSHKKIDELMEIHGKKKQHTNSRLRLDEPFLQLR